MIVTINIIVLSAMIATAIYINRLRSLMGVVMLAGIYSLLTALFFFLTDAVDVAFTEAAVGAGISTVIFLSAIGLTTRNEKKPKSSHRWMGLFVVGLTAVALIVGTTDLPPFGALSNVTNNEIYEYYLAGSYYDIHIPNAVTAVLGSYRGYDTFGEVVVVFAAVVGVLALLWNAPAKEKSAQKNARGQNAGNSLDPDDRDADATIQQNLKDHNHG